jgi:hypothetical protein
MSTLWNASTELLPVGRTPIVGDVAEFDEARGLGVVEYGPGRRLPFHCTAITDGSRQIDVGVVVAFVVAAGRLGRLEARTVRPLPGVVPPGSTLPVVDADDGDDADSDHGDDLHAEVEGGTVGTGAAGGDRPLPPPLPPAAPIGGTAGAERVEGGLPVGGIGSGAQGVGGSARGRPDGGSSEGGSSSLPDTTPPLGTPSVAPLGFAVSDPVADTPWPLGRSEEPEEPEESRDDAGSPKPDFWSPLARTSTAPPPTWRTPVTPSSPAPPDDG